LNLLNSSIIAGLIALHAGAQNVGIGTNTPTELLHIKNGSLLIENPLNAAAEIKLMSGAGNGFIIENKSNGSFNTTLLKPFTGGIVGNGISINQKGFMNIGNSFNSYPLIVKTSTEDIALRVESIYIDPIKEVNGIYASHNNGKGAAIRAFVSAVGVGGSLTRTDFAYGVLVQAGTDRYGVGSFTQNKPAVLAISRDGTAVEAESLFGLALSTKGDVHLTKIGEGTGKLLVSDATGNATWQNPPKITVDQAGAAGLPSLEFRNGGAYRGGFGWDQSTGRFFFFDGESGTNTFFINNGRMGIQRNPTTNDFEVNGNASKATAGSWLGNSDARLKKDMQPLTGALDKLKQLEGITFQWNDTKTGMKRPEGNQIGFTAQNIQQVFPEAVTTDAQGYLQTAYGTYDPLLVEAMKELLKKIEVLEQKVKTLENK